jgi:tubulin polyglutamylase TTLL6/13
MILGQPLISHQYKFAQPDDEYRNMCFHILGIDVMINESLEPFILEVNHTPSFATDTPLDYFIKFNLIKDTLILMNIGEESKKKLVEKTKCYQRERIITGKKLMESEEQR